MSKKVLYMHTGSGNHGCEALVRTSAAVLGGPEEVDLWSFTKAEDEKYGTSETVGEIFVSEQLKRGSAAYLEALFRRKVLKQPTANMDVFLKKLFQDKIAVAIGGDNYCYEWSAKQGAELDAKIRKYCRKNVLWGCSINEEALTEEIRKDLAGYDLITARECLTYELLKQINPNTVKVADTAFLLERTDLPLPEGFVEGNTVGLNISPLIMKYGTDSNLILENYECLIEYILKETDMHICLIPHVVWEYNNDREPIDYLYQKYVGTGRVCRIEDGNCCELKGYIARCRFFVGARTHATIAAYSSYVPTLVVGYSIKSKGIARDLFGTEENYVIPVQELKEKEDIRKRFSWLMDQEQDIKEKLKEVIPAYQDLAKYGKDALEELLK